MPRLAHFSCFTGNKRWCICIFVVLIWMLLILQNNDNLCWNYEEPEAWPVTFLNTSCFCINPLPQGPGAERGQGACKVITDWQPRNHFFIKVHMVYIHPARLCSLLTWLFPLGVLKRLALQILVSYPASSLLGLFYSLTSPHLSALATVPAKPSKQSILNLPPFICMQIKIDRSILNRPTVRHWWIDLTGNCA